MEKLLCICTIGFCDQASSWSSSCGWTEELCSQQSFQIGVLKLCTGICATVSHVLGSHASERGTIITEQVWLGIGIRVHSVGFWDSLLVTACCDNNGVSGVVTWKSLGGVFVVRFFPIYKKITVSFIFRYNFSLLVICLCYNAFAW